MPKFNMDAYTGVNDRMKLAADTWQSIIVSPPVMLTDLTGYVSATVTLKDGRVVTEIAAFRLGLTGASAQANFPVEDAATSAVGRALGRFGFGTDAKFPSREEMQQVERVQDDERHPRERIPIIRKTPPPKKDTEHDKLATDLKRTRIELGEAGGHPSSMTSSEVAVMTVDQLRDEIAFTRAEIAIIRKRQEFTAPELFEEIEG